MLESLFIQLSLIIVIAVVISVLMRTLKQPLIIGYILTGILVGPYFLNIAEIGAEGPITVFSKFGITFLLFAVSLIWEIGFDREELERMKEEHLAQLERLEEEDFDYQFGEGLM